MNNFQRLNVQQQWVMGRMLDTEKYLQSLKLSNILAGTCYNLTSDGIKARGRVKKYKGAMQWQEAGNPTMPLS
jgi:hypothetical protein